MNLDKSAALQEKKERITTSNVNMKQINYVQNVIRNKFKKACRNRLEHEYNANRAMKPLTATTMLIKNDSPSRENIVSRQSDAKHKINSRIISKNDEKMHALNPNALCDKLRFLLQSQFTGNSQHTHEINSLFAELREQNIIV